MRPFCDTVNLSVSLAQDTGGIYRVRPERRLQLWFESGGRLARGKCQLRLEIESKLKAWLLQRCGVPLSTLSYEELRLVAEGRTRDALRLMRTGSTSS